jgi:hypothetical protein
MKINNFITHWLLFTQELSLTPTVELYSLSRKDFLVFTRDVIVLLITVDGTSINFPSEREKASAVKKLKN